MAGGKYVPQAKYIKGTIRRFNLNLNKNTDASMIAHLEKTENVQGYLKRLIRADMERAGE